MNPLSLIPVEYQWLAKAAGALIVAISCWFIWQQFTGHYIQIGKDEVQVAWDKEKAAQKAVDDKQAIIDAGHVADAAKAQKVQALQHQEEIDQIRRQSNANTQAAITDNDAQWRNSLRVAVGADRARAASEISSATGGRPESGGNCDAAATRYKTLEDACKVTTSDYNYLHSSWDRACQIYGCAQQ